MIVVQEVTAYDGDKKIFSVMFYMCHVRMNLRFRVHIIKVCRQRQKTFCFCCVSFYSFLFFSTADFLQRFLRHFSTDYY